MKRILSFALSLVLLSSMAGAVEVGTPVPNNVNGATSSGSNVPSSLTAGPTGSTFISAVSAFPNVSNRLPTPNDDYTAGYHSDNSVGSLFVTTNGSTCTSTPSLTIGAPASGGIQATGHFIMNVAGTATVGAVVDISGRGYTSNPTVTVGSGCSVTPVVTAYYQSNGDLWNYKGKIYINRQSDAGAAVWTFLLTPALPLDSIVNGVTAATIAGGSGGSGYATSDHITLLNGTVLNVSAQSGGVISTVTVVTPGNWQCFTASAQAQVSTTGSGTGASFVLTANWAQAAYGDHILTSCYTANKYADVTRASDSTVKTIGFTAAGVVDTTSILQFCAGTTCSWTKLYDQSGRAHDAPNTTTSLVDFGHNYQGNPLWYNGAFTMPAGVAYNAATMTAYGLTRNSACCFAGGLAFAFDAGINVNNNNGPNGGTIFQNPSGGFNVVAPVQANYTLELIGGTLLSTTNATYSIGDWEFSSSGSVSNGAGQTGGTVGGSGNSGLLGDMFVLWPRGFSAAERLSFKASVAETFNLYPQVRDLFVLAGDSRTAGQGSTNNVNYPIQILPLSVNSADISNEGVNGQQLQSGNIANFFMTTGDGTAMISRPHNPKNSWLILWDGYNDFTGGIALGTFTTSLTTYVSMVHALGYKIMVVNDPETTATWNTMYLANSYGADAVCNYQLDPVWGPNSYTSQTFISFPHPTTFGYGYVAQDTATCINAYIH